MRRKTRKLTLEDIGNLAGVSRATVSRVINNYPHITAEVRERVQSVIQETGYQPNRIAQSLASKRTGIIGLVIPHVATTIMTNPYFLHLITSITKATNQNNLTLSLFLFHSMDEEERIAKTLFNTNLVDGVIVTADRRENPFVSRLVRNNVPVVFVGKPELGTNVSYVNSNNEAGGFIATKHLIERGCQRVAAIAALHNSAGDDRFVGYKRALQTYGMPYDENLVAEADYSQESGYEAMKQLLKHKPDSVFVWSDLMAVGAQRAIREAGLRLPDDIGMVGFDDLPQALQGELPLTTIRQPIERLGADAVKLLQTEIDNPTASAESRVLPVELIQRET